MGNLEKYSRLCTEMELLDIKEVLNKKFSFNKIK